MSLQVWLPLNGNLKNQGLSDITFINSGVNIDNNGKIGKCYHFNADQYIKESTYDWTDFNTSKFSLCCWYKEPSPVASGNSQIICIGTSSGWNNIRIGLLRRTSNGYPLFSVSDGSTAIQYGFTASTFTLDTWNHIAVTYNNGELKIYLNGILNKTGSTTIIPVLNSSQHLGIGAASNGAEKLTGYLNDVRIYDHCLSKKEVEEISKGLVLHYKLDGDGKGNDNILINTHFDNRYIQSSGWDTSKNGTLLANSWGGYNSGVNNQATVYHAHLKEFNGEYVYEYIKTTNESWLGISQGGLQTKIIAGQTYTFSWEEYHVDGTNRVGTGLYYYKTGATSANFHLGIQSDANITRVFNQWQKYSYTFTAPSDADYNKNISWYIYGHYNGNGTFYMRHPKLELGNSATSWTPNSNDGIYNLYNTSIIYDSSGYQNNGEIINNISIISDTPRYNAATHMSATNQKIKISNFPTSGFGDSYTFAWWEKISSVNPMHWGFADGIRLNGMYTGRLWNTGDGSNNPLYIPGTTTQVTTPTANVWHHWVMTGNGSKCLVYQDGELWAEAKTYKSISGQTIYINGWDSGTSYCSDNASMSDFRIYCTALTAEQIKELYDTSATIDKNGNIYAREVIE